MQLELPESELERLGRRIQEDFADAQASHRDRMVRFARYYRKWRNLTEPPRAGEEDFSNFSVPMTQWHVFGRWSQELARLFGDDAEVIAKPTGPSDHRVVSKVGRFMTWRLFSSMKITNPLTVFTFRKILFGRTHAYRPWVRDEYKTDRGKQLWYEGPGFFPMWPDDLVVPAEDADSIQDFSWVARKVRLTPQQLLNEERKGFYFGIEDDFGTILQTARQEGERGLESLDDIKAEKDDAEGVLYAPGSAARGKLLVYEWYGRWRLLRGKADASEEDMGGRDVDETEVVVSYVPALQRVIGAQSLVDLYPRMRNRRPFAEASLVKDGSYWCAGFGELLESIEDEATANHRLFTDAGRFGVGPLIFYRPGAGFQQKTFRYSPYTAIPTEDPGGVNIVQMRSNMEFSLANGQALGSYAEKATGVSDLALGRQIDRPNAPRTVGGTVALLQQGDVRADFDARSLREDMRVLLEDIWALDCDMSPKKVFFRVTEEQAKGLFETKRGGATLTAEERAGRFDFDIKFADSFWSREAKKQQFLQLYQLLLANPFVAQNARLLALVTRELCKHLGHDDIADAIPMPPEPDLPKTPTEEWTLLLEGEDAAVNPADNDELHLREHREQLAEAQETPVERRDIAAERALLDHIAEHKQQQRMKAMMQALTQHLVDQVAENVRTRGPGLTMGGAPVSLQQLHATVGNLIGAAQNPGDMPGQMPGQEMPGQEMPGEQGGNPQM